MSSVKAKMLLPGQVVFPAKAQEVPPGRVSLAKALPPGQVLASSSKVEEMLPERVVVFPAKTEEGLVRVAAQF